MVSNKEIPKNKIVSQNESMEQFEASLSIFETPKFCPVCHETRIVKDGVGFRCLDCLEFFIYEDYELSLIKSKGYRRK